MQVFLILKKKIEISGYNIDYYQNIQTVNHNKYLLSVLVIDMSTNHACNQCRPGHGPPIVFVSGVR